LPCAGNTVRRCYYVSWPNFAEVKSQFKFTLEFPEGNSLDLSEKLRSKLQETVGDKIPSPTEFAEAVNFIATSVTDNAGNFRLTHLATERALETFMIEFFECLSFSLEMNLDFGENIQPFFRIMPQFTSVRFISQKTGIDDLPAFNIERFNKCKPEQAIEEPCAKPLDLKLKIKKSQVGNFVKLDAEFTGSDAPVNFLWEGEDASPPLAQGQAVSFNFNETSGSKTIRLIVFTKGGCRAFAETTIELAPFE